MKTFFSISLLIIAAALVQFNSIKGNGRSPNVKVQREAPWHLVRLSQAQATRSLDVGPHFYRHFNQTESSLVDVYVLDSGVNCLHSELIGHCNLLDDQEDDNGHGTHVAGLVSGWQFGIVKGVTVHSIKVLDRNLKAQWAQVEIALEFVLDKVESSKRPSIINLSLLGARNEKINQLIRQLHALNVPVVTSAGNLEADACNYSPASSEFAITVGASTEHDEPIFNHGPCIDIYAPGISIQSSDLDQTTSFKSGTSMSAALVTGILANWMIGNVLTGQEISIDLLKERLIGSATAVNGILIANSDYRNF